MNIRNYRSNTRINYCFGKMTLHTPVVILKEMFDKFLRKVKIAPYVLAHVNTLDVLCRFDSREIRENQCFEHIPSKVYKGKY